MTNDDKPNPPETEKVRLISRAEADEAIKSGVVVTKHTQTTFPTIVDDDATLIDLRSADRGDGDVPEDSQLPHWTEPATGEVPTSLGADDAPEVSGPRWRDSHSPWREDEPQLHDLGKASGLGESEPSEELPEEIAPTTGERFFDSIDINVGPAAEEEPAKETPVFDQKAANLSIDTVSLAQRVITGSIFAAGALVAFLLGPPFVIALAAIVLLLAAAEYFDGVRRVGYKPAAGLGLLAVAGLVGGAYARGEAALPLILGITLLFTFLWYLTGVIKESPTVNIAVTMLGVVWIGVLGSYAALLLRMPERHGMAYLLGAVLVTAAYDTGAYLGGSAFGRHKLSPTISPNKSWEGLAAGTAAAVVMGAFIVSFISPWSVVDAIVLGLIVSIIAPLGDLGESMVKRDLGLKDMGRILPGHGGVLDRFDAMLLVFPATYYLVLLLHV